MARAALSLEQAPPLSVPIRFFLTAPLFAVLAGVLLLWGGPDVLASRWTPPAVALTHLLTLGFVTMVAMGALLQMLPVLAGASAPGPRLLADLVHPLMVLGTLGLGAGFLVDPALLRLGGSLLGVAMALFLAAMAAALLHLRGNANPTVRGMRLALVGLGVAAALGLARATAFAWGVVIPPSFADLHVAWALFGWVGTLIVAVAFQVVPMFQITPDYPEVARAWLPRLLVLFLALWSAATLAGWMPAVAALEGLLGLAFCAFAGVTLRLQAQRRRKVTDPFLWYWRLGMGAVLAAAALRLASWIHPDARLTLVFGVVVLVGVIQTVVVGMLYKIVPFLTWLHSRNRPGGVHNMSQVLPESASRQQLLAHTAALALLLLACALPHPATTTAAALAYAAGFALLALRLTRAVSGVRS